MNTNLQQAMTSIQAQPGTGMKLIVLSIYASAASVALLGILGWGAMAGDIIKLIVHGNSVVDYVRNFFLIGATLSSLPLLLAFGIYKKSRVCAALPAIGGPCFILWVIYYLGRSFDKDWTMGVLALFILMTLMGFVGTVVYHWRRKASKPPA